MNHPAPIKGVLGENPSTRFERPIFRC